MAEETNRHNTMAPMDWVGECNSIADQSEESALDLEELAHSRRQCARCGVVVSTLAARAADKLRRSQDALRVHSRRYRQMLGDLDLERGKREEMDTKNKEREEELKWTTFREKKELREEMFEQAEEMVELLRDMGEMEQERDRLRDSLATKEEDHRKETKRLAEERREAELERDRLRASLTITEDQLQAVLATREKESGRGGLLLPWIPCRGRWR